MRDKAFTMNRKFHIWDLEGLPEKEGNELFSFPFLVSRRRGAGVVARKGCPEGRGDGFSNPAFCREGQIV